MSGGSLMSITGNRRRTHNMHHMLFQSPREGAEFMVFSAVQIATMVEKPLQIETKRKELKLKHEQ
jgi:hypothetical protein